MFGGNFWFGRLGKQGSVPHEPFGIFDIPSVTFRIDDPSIENPVHSRSADVNEVVITEKRFRLLERSEFEFHEVVFKFFNVPSAKFDLLSDVSPKGRHFYL